MKKILILAAAAAMTFAACEKAQNPVNEGAREVRFTVANIGTYVMKAETVGIDETGAGKVGIYAPGLNTGFAEATVSGSALTLPDASKIYWGVGQTSASTFYAIYPYASGNSTTKTYEIPVDQSSIDTYSYQNNVVTAVKSATPADAAVALNFTHPFAKMVIGINNKNAGGDIVTSVVVKGLKTSAALDLTAEPAGVTLAAAADMTAYGLSTASQGALQYALIVAPQADVTPQIVVTTALGSVYTFDIETAYSFVAGKIATTSVELAAVSGGSSGAQQAPVSAYSFTTTAWDDAAVQPVNPTAGTPTYAEYWNVIGTVYGADNTVSAWAVDFPMTCGTDGKWSITINYDESKAGEGQGVGFKLRKFSTSTASRKYNEALADPAKDADQEVSNYKWANQLGFFTSTGDDYQMADGGDYNLSNAGDSKNIRLASAGSWTLVLDGVSLTATKN